MGSPAIVIFCRNGHVARVIKRDEVNGAGVRKCKYCGSTEFGLQVGWDDEGYDNVVPRDSLGYQYIDNTKVHVFDIEGIKDWCRLTPDVIRVCKDCKEEFTLRGGEIDFYKQEGLSLPKRCPKCRKARRQREAE